MQYMMSLAAACLLGLAMPALAQTSSYTRHDYEKCSKPRPADSDPVEVRVCKGAANIPVRWNAGDDSSNVVFGSKPLDEDTAIGSFFTVEGTIEWRTAPAGKAPIAAIVRYSVGDSVGKLNRKPLVIYRIEPSGRSCIMGVAQGANANVSARALVDGSAASFVCGTGKRKNV